MAVNGAAGAQPTALGRGIRERRAIKKTPSHAWREILAALKIPFSGPSVA
jgi:hypothetical protein